MNGLAPQTFKPQPYRSNTRPRKQNRTSSQSDANSSQTSAQTSNQTNTRPSTQLAPSVSLQGTTKTNATLNKPASVCDNSRGTPGQHAATNTSESHATSSISLGNISKQGIYLFNYYIIL